MKHNPFARILRRITQWVEWHFETRHKELLPLPKNRYGHYLLTVTVDDEERITFDTAIENTDARDGIMSRFRDYFTNIPPLENGQTYTIALVFGEEIACTGIKRTYQNIVKYGRKFGYIECPTMALFPIMDFLQYNEEVHASYDHAQYVAVIDTLIPNDKDNLLLTFNWFSFGRRYCIHEKLIHEHVGCVEESIFARNGIFAFLVPNKKESV